MKNSLVQGDLIASYFDTNQMVLLRIDSRETNPTDSCRALPVIDRLSGDMCYWNTSFIDDFGRVDVNCFAQEQRHQVSKMLTHIAYEYDASIQELDCDTWKIVVRSN